MKQVIYVHLSGLEIVRKRILMCVRASVVLMQCTLAHHVKFVRASCVNFHTLPNSNQGQIRSNLISHVFILNTNFNGHQFLVAKSALNGRNATVFALRFCGPPSWMRERVRSRIKSRPSDKARIQLVHSVIWYTFCINMVSNTYAPFAHWSRVTHIFINELGHHLLR